jgi:hypothetical protein
LPQKAVSDEVRPSRPTQQNPPTSRYRSIAHRAAPGAYGATRSRGPDRILPSGGSAPDGHSGKTSLVHYRAQEIKCCTSDRYCTTTIRATAQAEADRLGPTICSHCLTTKPFSSARQAVKIVGRRHARKESDSCRFGNLIIIPMPRVLPLLRRARVSIESSVGLWRNKRISRRYLHPIPPASPYQPA